MTTRKLLTAVASIALVCVGPAGLPANATMQAQAEASDAASAEDWRRWAVQDVNAAYYLYVENHPGINDSENPDFPARLVAARLKGLEAAERATEWTGYSKALANFSRELNDGHALASAKRPEKTNVGAPLWPGFIAAWRGDKALVYHASEALGIPKGSEILACDGMEMRAFMPDRLPFLRPAEAGQWWAYAAGAFNATEGVPHPAGSCRFRAPDGRVIAADLNWFPPPEDYGDHWWKSSDGEVTQTGLTEPRPGMFLIGLPNFNPQEQGIKRLRELQEALTQRRAELKGARAVVIDLKYNNGGSSSWPREIAEILWGKDAFDDAIARFNQNVSIWWRASEDNATYVTDGIVPYARRAGHLDGAEYFLKIGRGMHAARRNGDTYYIERTSSAGRDLSGPPVFSDFTVPVYVITPGRCASACLDAVDYFTRFPNVRLIGAPTSADSTYMEVRYAELPSGRGTLVIPNKMWVGRGRANGEFYRPHIEMTDLDWSTSNFLDWIERDLASES